ncbi:alanine/glycine:cation symporter family protein [Saccharomonospora glauca]|uniref:Amino acid carrier protein n=1 Tax=Saccharomonospora glauca K62 TaxID=928724 RepID=I1D2P9_9PSEU|nr:alanine/glycine:cation symporter family protein [Saccharomonospora glauca]EIE99223.1 amino acid carrier protein [Saccharomonospora glauca K62]
MDALMESIGEVNDVFWTYLVIPLLVLLGLYFTVRTAGVQFRMLPQMFRDLRGTPEQTKDGKKAVSSFQAFSISAAARIGTGNIVGVALAISLGGPGAVFWMWVMAIIVSSLAFAESTLAQLFKVRDRSGYRGGPAYYMQHGLNARWLGVIFAVVIIFTFGFSFNMVQANSIAEFVSTSVTTVTGAEEAPGWVAPVVGLALVAVVGAVVFGGARRIAQVAQLTVPFMALVYLIVGLVVVGMNLDKVPDVFADIVSSAFGFEQIGGAAVGTAIMQGVRRGLFSNEAGMGSAPNAGASAAVSHPVKQGLAQSLGVYFDTLLVCSITAFIILVSDPDYGADDGGLLTQTALESHFGSWAVHLLTILILLLAFTSVLGNTFYGEANLRFLTGDDRVVPVFRAVVLGMLFLGAVSSLNLVWSFADVTMGVMAVVNLIAVAPLGALVMRLLKDYQQQRREGLDPVFTRDKLPDVRGIQCWEKERESTDRAPAPEQA